MPFHIDKAVFAVIQIDKETRRKLKRLAVDTDRPMYQVLRDLVTAATQPEDTEETQRES